jgi:hypothetical protein
MLTIPTDQRLAVGHGLAAQTTRKIIPPIALSCDKETSLKTHLKPSLRRIQPQSAVLHVRYLGQRLSQRELGTISSLHVLLYTFSRRRPAPRRTRWLSTRSGSRKLNACRSCPDFRKSTMLFRSLPLSGARPSRSRTSKSCYAAQCLPMYTWQPHVWHTCHHSIYPGSVGGPYTFVGGKSPSPHRLRLRHYHPSSHRSHCNHCHRHGQYNPEYNYRYRRR